MMKTVAVLCAQKRSVYHRFSDLDIYDQKRDAFTFTGAMPVIAHPPCRLWGRLSHFAKSPDVKRELELGIFCAVKVRECGGVLEHPVGSRLFPEAGLPRPDECSEHGFTIKVSQFLWGHRAQKDTWLFISGIRPVQLPQIPFRLLSPGVRPVQHLGRSEREATPFDLAAWLVDLARRIAVAKQNRRAA